MQAKFYLSEAKGFEGKLFFKLTPDANVRRFGTDAVTEFDGVASEEHKVLFAQAYNDFLNPPVVAEEVHEEPKKVKKGLFKKAED